MYWKTERKEYKHHQKVRDPFYCLLPRYTEDGYTIWLERVVREREWFNDGSDTFWIRSKTKYFLTEQQKTRIGLKW